MSDDLKDMALHYHQYPTPGKLAVTATKPLANQRDLALAYSPGVAAACEAIVEDPAMARAVTAGLPPLSGPRSKLEFGAV